jgi:hypothetical protein
MNLAGKRILVCGGRDFTDYPAPLRDDRRLFPALVLRPAAKSSFAARHPVPIVDEARLAPPAVGLAKGTTLC